ncbi:MAG: DUF167 domain-containing protein [Planctomycetota bacterium]
MIIEPSGLGVRIRVKAVPGSKRDAIAGPLGDRLKVKVAAPPEGGKANAGICDLLAQSLGAKPRDVSVVSGHMSPEKIIEVLGVPERDAIESLGLPPQIL